MMHALKKSLESGGGQCLFSQGVGQDKKNIWHSHMWVHISMHGYILHYFEWQTDYNIIPFSNTSIYIQLFVKNNYDSH